MGFLLSEVTRPKTTARRLTTGIELRCVQVPFLLFITSQFLEKMRHLRKKECFHREGMLSRALLKMDAERKAKLVASENARNSSH